MLAREHTKLSAIIKIACDKLKGLKMSIPSTTLSNGSLIPKVGFGTWQIKDEKQCHEAINEALGAGYRHIDTAQIYGNEKFIGESLSRSGVKRSELFITTKISVVNFTASRVIPSFDKSLINLQSDYVDLLLLHFPVPKLRHKAWKKMEEIYDSGRAKNIGVSNYTVKHLEKLLSECRIRPAVNQVELHVFLQQPELIKYCMSQDIAIEAYSPLAHGYGLDNKTLEDIAKKYSKSTAQIMLRWCLEAGTIPLPKSISPKRIAENIAIFDFELDDNDLKQLKALDSNHRTCWDPTHIP